MTENKPVDENLAEMAGPWGEKYDPFEQTNNKYN